MIRQSFISVVGILNSQNDLLALPAWLTAVYRTLQANFSDFEIVLVNNQRDLTTIDNIIKPLPEELRKQIFLLNLSSAVNRDNAILAGLDRANGDYTVLFESDFAHNPDLITSLWDICREGFDVVYLRARERKLPATQKVLYHIFYYILKKYSRLQIDPWAHHSRIISRRALNSLLRLRENSRYLKANYALVGYKTGFIDVDVPLHPTPEAGFGEQFRTALVAVTSFTTFLRSLLLWIFMFSVIVACTAVYNAVKVKLTSTDIFGDHAESLSGWAFLVVIISVFFAITCLNLYVMSIYLSNIYSEIKNRPLYIVESVKRY